MKKLKKKIYYILFFPLLLLFLGISLSGGLISVLMGSDNYKPSGKTDAIMPENEFVQKMGSECLKYYSKYKILPSCIIAQAILESGWGKTELAAKYNNYFGMKYSSNWKGKPVNMATKEYNADMSTYDTTQTFRSYPSFGEGVKGYFEFVTEGTRYQNMQGIMDYKVLCKTVSEDGWNQNPAYITALIDLIDKNGLTYYDELAIRGKTVPSDVGKEVKANSEVAQKFVNYAIDKVGCQYDQGRRMQKGYYDCSSLVYRGLSEVCDIKPDSSIADGEAKWCENNNLIVCKGLDLKKMQPGDIIFTAPKVDSRYGSPNYYYKNIGHVGIYIGNNEWVEAQNRANGVVRCSITNRFNNCTVVEVARPTSFITK